MHKSRSKTAWQSCWPSSIGPDARVASKSPSVLILIKGLGVGGAEKLLSEGAQYWDRDSFDYHVAYALPWKDNLVDSFQALGIPVHLIGGRRGLTPGVPIALRRVIAREGIDLIHAHSPTMGVIARMVTSVPVVYTEHNMTDSYRRPTRLLNRATYTRNRAVIAVSDAVAGSVSTWPGPQARVISNGVACRVEENEVAIARDELGLDPDTPLIAHVGNIRPGKGHDVLIDTASVLHANGRRFRWVSIGGEKYPGDLARVRDRASKSGLSDHLQFLGRRSDALSFVGAADVFVNPSEVEGLPVAVLEAMALGRPVVATAVGGVPSVIKNGETGLLVEPGDPEALAREVERMLDDRSLATSLAKEGQALVEKEYGLEPMVRAVEDVYREVVS